MWVRSSLLVLCFKLHPRIKQRVRILARTLIRSQSSPCIGLSTKALEYTHRWMNLDVGLRMVFIFQANRESDSSYRARVIGLFHLHACVEEGRR